MPTDRPGAGVTGALSEGNSLRIADLRFRPAYISLADSPTQTLRVATHSHTPAHHRPGNRLGPGLKTVRPRCAAGAPPCPRDTAAYSKAAAGRPPGPANPPDATN